MRSAFAAILLTTCAALPAATADTIVDDTAPSGAPTASPPAPYSDSDFLYQHYVPKASDPQQNGLYYRLYLPRNYATSGSALHPLVIFHHGDGEKENSLPPRNQKQLSDNGQYNFCSAANQATFPCFVAMVQAAWWGRDASGQMTGPGMVAALVARYRIDPDRVIVTGLSGGGGCSLSWAGQRPDVYAGFVTLSAPSPGDPGSYQPMNLARLPGWFFGSRSDGIDVNPSTARDIRAFGGNPALTVYNSGGHSRTTWNAAYSTPALYPWLNGLRRGQTPQMPVEVAFTAPAASGPVSTASATVTPAGTTLDRQLDGASAGVSAVSWYTADDAAGLDGETALGASTATGTTTWTASGSRSIQPGDTYIVATATGTSLHPTQAGITVYSRTLAIHRTGAAAQELDVSYNGASMPDGYRQSVTTGGSAGSATQLSFVLSNGGGSVLGISGTPAISYGSNPNCTAAITTAPAASIAAGASSTMVATVTPTANGLWEFRIAIASDDANENPYNLIISGNAGLAAPANVAPVANAGSDQAITLAATASLAGSATDDMLPSGSSLSYAWSKISGPGTVAFGSASSAATTATFSAAGTYVLQLAASDGSLTGTDTVTITVSAAGANTAPVANAGSDQAITLSATASLAGSATDDGLPSGSSLSYAWSKISGPGTVAFGSASNAATTATFSAAGSYVLQLAASDGSLTGTDTVTISVGATGGGTTTTIRIDLGDGGATTSGTWNNLYPNANLSIADCIDSTGAASGIAVTASGFGWSNAQGISDSTLYPASAQSDSLPVASGSTATVVFSNLSATATYDVTCFASRQWNNPSSADYSIGATTHALEAYNNTANVAQFTGLSAGGGTLTLSVAPSSGSATAYLGVVILTQHSAGSPTNTAPVADAGADQAIALPATASLSGSASDDGLPSGSALSCAWSKISGPGTVTFGSATSAASTAAFSAAGTYVLQFAASDGSLAGTDTMTVTVTASAVNAAPVADAGADQAITLPATASLAGSASDDGLPSGSALSYAWSTISGPGTVTFGSAYSATTTAVFSAAGTYVLQLAASDGSLAGTDTMTVTVAPDPASGGTDVSVAGSGTAAGGGCGAGAIGLLLAASAALALRIRRRA